jgi:hypothetical protein
MNGFGQLLMAPRVVGGQVTMSNTSNTTTPSGGVQLWTTLDCSRSYVLKVFKRVFHGSPFCANVKIFVRLFTRLIWTLSRGFQNVTSIVF